MEIPKSVSEHPYYLFRRWLSIFRPIAMHINGATGPDSNLMAVDLGIMSNTKSMLIIDDHRIRISVYNS